MTDKTSAVAAWDDSKYLFCPRCICRHLCFSWNLILKSETEIIDFLESHYSYSADNSKFGHTTRENAQLNEKIPISHVSISCHSCLGILQTSFLEICIKELQKCMEKNHYVFASFRPQYFLPVQLHAFRQYGCRYFKKKCEIKGADEDPHEVKEVLKVILWYL